jgi:drug/metabolite transporter (DMT)-like permease
LKNNYLLYVIAIITSMAWGMTGVFIQLMPSIDPNKWINGAIAMVGIIYPCFCYFFAYVLLGDKVTFTLLFGVFLLILGMWNMVKGAR